VSISTISITTSDLSINYRSAIIYYNFIIEAPTILTQGSLYLRNSS